MNRFQSRHSHGEFKLTTKKSTNWDATEYRFNPTSLQPMPVPASRSRSRSSISRPYSTKFLPKKKKIEKKRKRHPPVELVRSCLPIPAPSFVCLHLLESSIFHWPRAVCNQATKTTNCMIHSMCDPATTKSTSSDSKIHTTGPHVTKILQNLPLYCIHISPPVSSSAPRKHNQLLQSMPATLSHSTHTSYAYPLRPSPSCRPVYSLAHQIHTMTFPCCNV